MSTFKQRVEVEQSELCGRCSRLSQFIHVNPEFPTLTINEQARLRYQLMLMTELNAVLMKRINSDFK